MVIGVKNLALNTITITRNGSIKRAYPSMWIPSTNVDIKILLPCEEIERGNRERCENVKQDLKHLGE